MMRLSIAVSGEEEVEDEDDDEEGVRCEMSSSRMKERGMNFEREEGRR